jgi:hypothetical protein
MRRTHKSSTAESATALRAAANPVQFEGGAGGLRRKWAFSCRRRRGLAGVVHQPSLQPSNEMRDVFQDNSSRRMRQPGRLSTQRSEPAVASRAENSAIDDSICRKFGSGALRCYAD